LRNRLTNREQERRDRDGDEREIPVEPEHQGEHSADREQVDEDAERRRGGEGLDRVDVVREGADQRPRRVRVVIGEREMLEVVVEAHA